MSVEPEWPFERIVGPRGGEGGTIIKSPLGDVCPHVAHWLTLTLALTLALTITLTPTLTLRLTLSQAPK